MTDAPYEPSTTTHDRSVLTRRQQADDAGMSLVELVVVMAVSSVLLLTLGAVYTSGLRTTSVVTAKTSATQDVALATDVVARRLRVAVAPSATGSAVAVAGADTVTFYASIASGSDVSTDPPPTQVTYQYDTGLRCLTETLVPGSGSVPPYTYPAASARTTCLVRGTVNGGSTSMFTYYTDATGTTTTAAASAVRSVAVSLSVTQTSGTGSATTQAGARAVLENLS